MKVGPGFGGVFGRTETFSDGSSQAVDENYIRESILDPQKQVVATYPNSMPLTKLSDKEITGVIEYLKTLK